jgi:GNAT superfamily N-acetyltransferase
MERSQTGEVLVVESGGTIVATGSLLANEIQAVFVRPDIQRLGYGKMIVSELERRSKARGLSEVVLSISLPSKEFYVALQYEVLTSCSLDVGDGQHLDYWKGRKFLP